MAKVVDGLMSEKVLHVIDKIDWKQRETWKHVALEVKWVPVGQIEILCIYFLFGKKVENINECKMDLIF